MQFVLSTDSKKKEQGIITESPIKNLSKLSYYGNKKMFWFVNNSEYHHRKWGFFVSYLFGSKHSSNTLLRLLRISYKTDVIL